MKKKRMGVARAIALLAIVGLAIFFGKDIIGERPYKHISADDIKSASVHAVPPDKTALIESEATLEELAGILRQVTIYRQDDSGRDMVGQLVSYTVELSSGEVKEVGAYGSYMYIDDVCYKAKYEPSEALNALGNKIIRGEK